MGTQAHIAQEDRTEEDTMGWDDRTEDKTTLDRMGTGQTRTSLTRT